MTKRILITGKNSYVGNQLADWLNKEPEKYTVVKESVRDGKWKEIDFSVFDVVVHVAGIAHTKETKKNKKTYYEVNRDLAYEVAKKAKSDKVRHFVFLSTMSVYGLDEGIINKETPLRPKNSYGKSKLEAEELISNLTDSTFNVAIVRPPMVYGKNCKGNYLKLSKLAKKIPAFPNIVNKRSMIYIDNLSEFIRLIIKNEDQGLFHPQNAEYVNTSEIVKLIAMTDKNRMVLTKKFNLIFNVLNIGIFKKVFGNLVYEKELSMYSTEYRVVDFKKSVLRTETDK